FTWGSAGKEQFTHEFGVIETIERTKIEDNACSKKNKTEVTIRRKPGASPLLFGKYLTRIIREIEDARRLFCYKHVVKTVFVLQERLPACLTIARHSVCYSPTFSTSLPYCSSTNGWAVPMAGRFC